MNTRSVKRKLLSYALNGYVVHSNRMGEKRRRIEQNTLISRQTLTLAHKWKENVILKATILYHIVYLREMWISVSLQFLLFLYFFLCLVRPLGQASVSRAVGVWMCEGAAFVFTFSDKFQFFFCVCEKMNLYGKSDCRLDFRYDNDRRRHNVWKIKEVVDDCNETDGWRTPFCKEY